jgi:hypothetical protein
MAPAIALLANKWPINCPLWANYWSILQLRSPFSQREPTEPSATRSPLCTTVTAPHHTQPGHTRAGAVSPLAELGRTHRAEQQVWGWWAAPAGPKGRGRRPAGDAR